MRGLVFRGNAAPGGPPPGPRHARSFPEAVVCALRGLALALRRQANLRAHVLIAGLMLAGGAAIGLSGVELGVIAAAIGLVIAAELLNTSIELLTDLVSPTADPRAGAVKDVSAAGVLVASGAAAAVAAFIVFPHLWPRADAAGRVAAALGFACVLVWARAVQAPPGGRGRRML